MNTSQNIWLSLGSNQGDKLDFLQKAVVALHHSLGNIKQMSSVYRTQSWGFNADEFLNLVVELNTRYTALEVFDKIKNIESQLGREHSISATYQSRTIDIDILFFGDIIVNDEHLTIPHRKLQERKFVLIPLQEIQPELLHPLLQQSITTLLQQCTDDLTVEKTDFKINLPKTITDLYNYIAIEGNIGAGKTSLTNLMADEFNAKVILERFAENPFLPKFYEDTERFALPVEMSFLTDRYQQLSDDLAQFDLFKTFIVSDYYIFKSLIFPQVTLSVDEYSLYSRIFRIMYKEIIKPDLYIYLYQNIPRLMENIAKRGRAYEKYITEEYLQKIQLGYNNFIQTERNLNILVIDVSEMDFVGNHDQYREIIRRIETHHL